MHLVITSTGECSGYKCEVWVECASSWMYQYSGQIPYSSWQKTWWWLGGIQSKWVCIFLLTTINQCVLRLMEKSTCTWHDSLPMFGSVLCDMKYDQFCVGSGWDGTVDTTGRWKLVWRSDWRSAGNLPSLLRGYSCWANDTTHDTTVITGTNSTSWLFNMF